MRNNDLIYFPYTFLQGIFSANKYQNVQTLVLFFGYPRSGSSTLASLLDAHKDMIIAHEINLLHYIMRNYRSQQLYFMMSKNSRLLASKERISAGYRGIVEGQYNGRSEKCLVIGDKKAGRTSVYLKNDPLLLKKTQKIFGKKLKCIHIIRNPFDMIATQSYGGNEQRKPHNDEELQHAIELCLNKIDTIAKIKESNEYDIFDVRHENIIARPEEELTRLINWLEIKLYPGYLEACKKHLFDQPHKSRFRVNWSEEQKLLVQKKIDNTSFLTGYTFDS